MSQTTEQSAAGTPEQPSEPQTAAFAPVQWFGTEPGSPYGPPPAPPAGTAFTPRDRGERPRRRYVDMALSAVVAAVVAAGTTAVVITNDSVASSASPVSAAASASNASGNPAAGTGSGPVAQTAGGGVSWTPVAAAVEPSVVAISVSSQVGEAQGSGVILDATGRVLTNNHVVSGVGANGQLTVTLSDGRAYSATVVGTDPSTDLAVIVMKGADKLTPATLGDSDAVKVGSPVMAVGNPLGLAGTVTTGIVSALDRPVTTTSESPQTSAAGDGGAVVTNAIQTDAAVNPGNSGGALVDATGRVIGIPSSIASLGSTGGGSQSGSIGLGFSIPINEAKSIADQLIAGGTAEHPYLGVGLKDGSVKDGTASRTAAVVATVSAGTPAAAAGLKVGDAVTAVDGEAVNGSESLVAQVRERSVGAQIDLTVVRSGSAQQISVTLTKRPAA